MTTNPRKVIVGMSGGVDSSVAALLLKQQGYDCVGVMLKLWAEEGFGRENQCCSLESANQARRIAAKIGIPFYLMDVVQPFYDQVVDPFIDCYLRGETPNPCASCNPLIRWKSLLKYADAMGAQFVATGHYVRTEKDEAGNIHLFRGNDPKKDQSYVISRLSQASLQRSLFPLANYHKSQVRSISAEYQLPSADKPDSQDICFIGDGDYRAFLKRMRPALIVPGIIRDQSGKILGSHEGLPFYTIGQRKGLRIAAEKPFYVLSKNADTNELIIGAKDDLSVNVVTAAEVNWISGQATSDSFNALAQFRYQTTPVPVIVFAGFPDKLTIKFTEARDGIAVGQIVVLYSSDGEVIASGKIMKTERSE